MGACPGKLSLAAGTGVADGPLYGYSVRDAVEEESEGALTPRAGSLYRVIARMMTEETVPLDEGAVNAELVTEATATDEEGRPRGAVALAAGNYFQAMGIDVLRGRAFTEEDLSVPGRVVVSRWAAETLWPGEAPIVGPEPEAWWSSSSGYTVRTDRADAVMPEIRALIREMAPEAPIYS